MKESTGFFGDPVSNIKNAKSLQLIGIRFKRVNRIRYFHRIFIIGINFTAFRVDSNKYILLEI